MQASFDKMRKLMAADALAAYPNHNKRFDIFTDASDYQLCSCILQEGLPVAYFSRKLNIAQRDYTTMEKEMIKFMFLASLYIEYSTFEGVGSQL